MKKKKNKIVTENKNFVPYAEVIWKCESFDEERNHAAMIVNTLRGFPNGFDLEKYPHEEDCEKASPGVVNAFYKVRRSMQVFLKGQISFDKEGNPSYKIFKPKNWKVELVEQEPMELEKILK